MVMEASPSPQCVGREFVRQYYTLLNRAPAHLHRFYNNYSSFVHGSVDSSRESNPAIGQKQIHQKIQTLNFQDCHAKINQVDSQSTLGNGVVVQVSGELSNAGHPMRRFTQTFVLAAQAPKKYYVHNDIFRYQDYGYTDEEDEELEGNSNINENTIEREAEIENAGVENDQEDQQNESQQLSAKISNIEIQSPTQQQASSIAQQQQQMYYSMPPQQQQVHPSIQQLTVNGSVHDDNSISQSIQPSLQSQQYIAETATHDQFHQENEQNSQQQHQQQLVKTETQIRSEEIHHEAESEQNYILSSAGSDTDHQIAPQNINNSGPKTYANLVKSFQSIGITTPQVSKSQIPISPPQSLRNDDHASSYQSSGGLTLSVTTSGQINPHIHRMMPQQQSQQQQYQQRLPRASGPVQRDGEHRPARPGFPDSHQLFLGNLPHNASESDLRRVFERYGRVADLRVHSKQNDRSKSLQGTNSTRVPNYGFITFEDVSVVKLVLADCPIYFPDKHGQKLNIEEKKVRPREGGGSRLNVSDGNMRPLTTQQQQRGPGGPGTMMRGGLHGARVRGGYNRSGGEGGRGGLRQSGGNSSNQNYQTRR